MSKTRKFEEVVRCLALLDSRKKVESAKHLIRQNPEILNWCLRYPYCVFCDRSMSSKSELTCQKCHKHTIPADNSLEYVLLCFQTVKKLSADGGDFIMEIVDFFKDRGAKFRTEVNGPMAKYGRTPYLYLSFGFSDKSSPYFREKLDGTEQRTMLKILAATCDKPRKTQKEPRCDPWPEPSKKPRLEGYNNGDRRVSVETPKSSSAPKRRLLVVSSSNDGSTTESYIEIGKKRPSTSTYTAGSPPKMRDRHDSGRSSMKSDDMKPTIKIERSPPVFPETVGTRCEMTPDEFYAQSLRLDFPRSTLDPEDIFQLWRKTCLCPKRKSEWIEKTRRHNDQIRSQL